MIFFRKQKPVSSDMDFSLEGHFGEELLKKIKQEIFRALEERDLASVSAAGAPQSDDCFRKHISRDR